MPSASAWHPCLCSLARSYCLPGPALAPTSFVIPPPDPQPTISKWSLLRTPGAPPLPDRSSFPLLPSVFLPLSGLPMGMSKLPVYSHFPRHLDQGPSGGTSALTPKNEGTSSRLSPQARHMVGGQPVTCGLDGGALHTHWPFPLVSVLFKQCFLRS